MLVFKPFFIQMPCCGYHDNAMYTGLKSYAVHEANVLVLSGVPTRAAWALVQKTFAHMAQPCWLMVLGAPQAALYDEAFVPTLGLKPHVCIQTCPVTKEVVEEGFRLLLHYVKKERQ